ncbi:MAG: 16S rRNA (uracil(1498)-N(3))-methyltransferase [Treponema sp.]|nr:16S rRNA (uracil(1498)-N(3))-methyltransferase [Treponema sp.]
MRQFISVVPFDERGMLTVRGKDFTHLCRVLRSGVGDMLYVRFPDGALAPMTVCSVYNDKKIAELQLCVHGTTQRSDNNTLQTAVRGVSAFEIDEYHSSIAYTLFQWIAKPQKMELIIRQATECGVKTIVPVAGAFSQKSCIEAMRTKRLRFEKIIKEAREQSGSPVGTVVHDVVSVHDACTLWQKLRSMSGAVAVVLSERSDLCKPLSKIIDDCTDVKNAALAVGSEGGINPEEIALLCNAGFTPVHFSGNILRCETAALYGIAALRTHLEKQ